MHQKLHMVTNTQEIWLHKTMLQIDQADSENNHHWKVILLIWLNLGIQIDNLKILLEWEGRINKSTIHFKTNLNYQFQDQAMVVWVLMMVKEVKISLMLLLHKSVMMNCYKYLKSNHLKNKSLKSCQKRQQTISIKTGLIWIFFIVQEELLQQNKWEWEKKISKERDKDWKNWQKKEVSSIET